MNYSMIFYIMGHLLKFEALFLLLPMLAGFAYNEIDASIYMLLAFVAFVIGKIMTLRQPKNRQLFTKEGFVTVALGWIIFSLYGALPFVLTGDVPSYVDALFETISGFTTTGASILSDVEALSYTNLFWRSFTHWIGGMGVFVFILAILPMIDGSTMYLMKAESPGPSVDKFVPKVKDTAKILYSLYIGITVIQIICLLLAGMPVFDTLTLTFGTVGTGGFGIKNSSIGDYTSLQQNIITFFMIASGVNYSAYFLILSKNFKDAFKMEEVRCYFGIIFVSAAIITLNTLPLYNGLGETLKHAFFQVGSIITTTGYSTVDFDLWPELSKTVLVLLMVSGACAGSTGGGFKVSRIIILLKSVKKELSLMMHPRQIKKIRMDGHVIKHEVLRATNVFTIIYFTMFFVTTLLISIDNFDFTTNFTAVAATLNNIGPGLAKVGPTCNFGSYSIFSKFILMFNMLAGRLELFPLILFIMPDTWKRNK
jgi:trk system potassium uptake protein TrkH